MPREQGPSGAGMHQRFSGVDILFQNTVILLYTLMLMDCGQEPCLDVGLRRVPVQFQSHSTHRPSRWGSEVRSRIVLGSCNRNHENPRELRFTRNPLEYSFRNSIALIYQLMACVLLVAEKVTNTRTLTYHVMTHLVNTSVLSVPPNLSYSSLAAARKHSRSPVRVNISSICNTWDSTFSFSTEP